MGRRVGLFLLVGAVLPLMWAANAAAQGAVLRATPSVVAPGGEITVNGRGYATIAAGASPVSLRFSTRTGRPLDTEPILVDNAGRFSVPVSIPATTPPGWYLLIATQTNPDGTQRGFTPGRTTVRVQARAGAGAGAATRPGGSSGGGLSLPLLLGAVGLGVGSLVTARRLRTLNRPPLGA